MNELFIIPIFKSIDILLTEFDCFNCLLNDKELGIKIIKYHIKVVYNVA